MHGPQIQTLNMYFCDLTFTRFIFMQGNISSYTYGIHLGTLKKSSILWTPSLTVNIFHPILALNYIIRQFFLW